MVKDQEQAVWNLDVMEMCRWSGNVMMAESGDRMQAVLEEYAKCVKERDLALAKHQPYLVCWVREFLLLDQGSRRIHLRADAGHVPVRDRQARRP